MNTIIRSILFPSLAVFISTRPLVTLVCAALAAFTHTVTAAPGDLDLTFGGTGKVTTDFSASRDEGYSVAVQSDGKILVAGTSYTGEFGNNIDFAVVRYNTNGSLDTSFGGTGKVTTDFSGSSNYGSSVAVQSDGKIVVAGYSIGGPIVFALVRYNANGSLDTTFNGTGRVTTAIGSNSDLCYSVAMQSDGKIVAAGSSRNISDDDDFALVRYNANGSLDTSFNGTGKVTTPIASNGTKYDVAHSVAVQSDQKIVVAGYSSGLSGNADFAVVRYNASGSLDTSFGGTGKVTTNFGSNNDYGNSVVIQSDQKIVVAGGFQNGFALARYSANGSLDASFNGTGTVTTDILNGVGSSVALQSDMKIVVAGRSNAYDFAVVRYNANGFLDTSFNGTGKVITDFGSGTDLGLSVTLQGDGKIVAAGFSDNGSNNDFAVVRYEGAQLSGPTSQTVNLGSAVTFSVTATGANPVGYQWKKDGVAIPGATASSYTIPSAGPWDIGDYTVIVTYSVGYATSGAALLQINGVPTAIWRGLVVFYPFDGDAMDREAGAAHAVVNGPSLTTDRMGQPNRAFDFDGINDQMTATVPILPPGYTSRTISLWAKARPDPSRSVGLVEWGLAQNGRAFGIANSGSPYNWNGKTYGAGNGVNSGTVVDSKWRHLCLTYEGGTLAIYVDGVLKQTKAEAINTALSELKMGVGVEGSTFYPGSLDEVRIYNRALSPSEVQQLFVLEDPDTDGDGIRDRFETGTGIYVSPTDTGTSPSNSDSDGDGLNDGQEVYAYHSNPNVKDSDDDGFDDGFEVATGFSPTSAASTPDALSTIRTAAEYRFNAALGISYRIEASTDLTNWTTIETNIIGAGGVITRFYSIEGQPKRFFRSRRN